MHRTRCIAGDMGSSSRGSRLAGLQERPGGEGAYLQAEKNIDLHGAESYLNI